MGSRWSKIMTGGAALAAATGMALFGLVAAAPAAAVEPPIDAGSIQISDEDGTRISGALITIVPIGPEGQLGTPLYSTTDVNGELALDTIAGFDSGSNPYGVWVNANGYAAYWDGTQDVQATVPINIVSGGMTIATTVPVNGPPDANSAGISGTVTDALTGLPLPGVIVSASDDGTGGDNQGDSQSAVDGTYYMNFAGGQLPSTAAVRFATLITSADAPYGYAGQYYDNVSEYSGQPENPVPVTAGATTSGINAAMMPNGLISGTVTVDGGPVTNGQVSAWSTVALTETSSTFVRPDGTYSMPTPIGTYRVQFQQYDANGNLIATLWFDDVATMEEGADVVVTAKVETPGIDAAFVTPPTPTPTPTPAALAHSGGSSAGVIPFAVLGVIVAGAGAAAVVVDRRRRAHR